MALKELGKELGREELEDRLRKLIEVSPPRVEMVPYLVKGFTTEKIEEGEKGFAIFDVKGVGVVEAEVTAGEALPQYSGCYVIHPRSPIKVISGTPATKATTVTKVTEKSKTIDLEDGETGKIELPSTTNCNQILLLIDDGYGGSPASYDIEFYHYNTPQSVYMLHSSFSSETRRSWEDDEATDQWKAKITNVSGDPATFRLYAQGKRI